METLLKDITITFVIALYSLPVIILGIWASTKSWWFYPVVLLGWGWTSFVIANSIWEVSQNAGFAGYLLLSTPVICFLGFNLVSISLIKKQRESAR